jgi:hypothetical protein
LAKYRKKTEDVRFSNYDAVAWRFLPGALSCGRKDSKDDSQRKSGILRYHAALVRMEKRIFNGHRAIKPNLSEERNEH